MPPEYTASPLPPGLGLFVSLCLPDITVFVLFKADHLECINLRLAGMSGGLSADQGALLPRRRALMNRMMNKAVPRLTLPNGFVLIPFKMSFTAREIS